MSRMKLNGMAQFTDCFVAKLRAFRLALQFGATHKLLRDGRATSEEERGGRKQEEFKRVRGKGKEFSHSTLVIF